MLSSEHNMSIALPYSQQIWLLVQDLKEIKLVKIIAWGWEFAHRAIGSCWLMGEEESICLECVATGRFSLLK